MNELWRIEAKCQPIFYCWPGGTVLLEPTHPICLPEYRALRILAKAKGGVKLILRIAEGQQVIWQADGGQSERVGYVEHIVKANNDWWVLVDDGNAHTWVRKDRVTYSSKSISEPPRAGGLGCESPPRSHRRRKGKNSMRQGKGGTA